MPTETHEDRERRRLEWLKHSLASRRQLQQATSTFEHAALKPAFLLNGGALVVVLAYMGSEGAERLNLQLAVIAVACWGLGLLSAAFATACAYLSQLAFYKATGPQYRALMKMDYDVGYDVPAEKEESEPLNKEGFSLRNKATWLGGGSLLAFGVGLFFGIIANARCGKRVRTENPIRKPRK